MTQSRADQDPQAAGFVLAGGQSSRMGCDKALVQYAGQTLITRAIAILHSARLQVFIAGARSSLDTYAPVIPDAYPGTGPLGGICSALGALPARPPHSSDPAVFIPVDVPHLPASLIRYLFHHARTTGAAITVSSVNGFPQTFPVALTRETHSVLQHELAAGRLGCFAAFQTAAAHLNQPISILPVEFLVQAGQVSHPAALPAARWFHNVNAPGDLDPDQIGRSVA